MKYVIAFYSGQDWQVQSSADRERWNRSETRPEAPYRRRWSGRRWCACTCRARSCRRGWCRWRRPRSRRAPSAGPARRAGTGCPPGCVSAFTNAIHSISGSLTGSPPPLSWQAHCFTKVKKKTDDTHSVMEVHAQLDAHRRHGHQGADAHAARGHLQLTLDKNRPAAWAAWVRNCQVDGFRAVRQGALSG